MIMFHLLADVVFDPWTDFAPQVWVVFAILALLLAGAVVAVTLILIRFSRKSKSKNPPQGKDVE